VADGFSLGIHNDDFRFLSMCQDFHCFLDRTAGIYRCAIDGVRGRDRCHYRIHVDDTPPVHLLNEVGDILIGRPQDDVPGSTPAG
jgi:hypothetical protein